MDNLGVDIGISIGAVWLIRPTTSVTGFEEPTADRPSASGCSAKADPLKFKNPHQNFSASEKGGTKGASHGIDAYCRRLAVGDIRTCQLLDDGQGEVDMTDANRLAGPTLDPELQALLSPSSVYAHPRDVLNDPKLTVREKRAILSSWASDACAVESCPPLRQPPGCKAVSFDEVMDALRALDEDPPPRPGGKPMRLRFRRGGPEPEPDLNGPL